MLFGEPGASSRYFIEMRLKIQLQLFLDLLLFSHHFLSLSLSFECANNFNRYIRKYLLLFSCSGLQVVLTKAFFAGLLQTSFENTSKLQRKRKKQFHWRGSEVSVYRSASDLVCARCLISHSGVRVVKVIDM